MNGSNASRIAFFQTIPGTIQLWLPLNWNWIALVVLATTRREHFKWQIILCCNIQWWNGADPSRRHSPPIDLIDSLAFPRFRAQRIWLLGRYSLFMKSGKEPKTKHKTKKKRNKAKQIHSSSIVIARRRWMDGRRSHLRFRSEQSKQQ